MEQGPNTAAASIKRRLFGTTKMASIYYIVFDATSSTLPNIRESDLYYIVKHRKNGIEHAHL